MICRGNLKGMSLNWQSHRPEVTLELEARPEDVEKLKDMELSVELKKYRRKRSLEANAYFYVLCGKIADVIKQSVSYVHNDMLRKYGQIELIDGKAVYLVLPETEEAVRKAGESETYHIRPTSEVRSGTDGMLYRTYIMLRGSHEYDTKEMSQLIDGTVDEARSLDIETLTPRELQEMMISYEKHHAK